MRSRDHHKVKMEQANIKPFTYICNSIYWSIGTKIILSCVWTINHNHAFFLTFFFLPLQKWTIPCHFTVPSSHFTSIDRSSSAKSWSKTVKHHASCTMIVSILLCLHDKLAASCTIITSSTYARAGQTLVRGEERKLRREEQKKNPKRWSGYWACSSVKIVENLGAFRWLPIDLLLHAAFWCLPLQA